MITHYILKVINNDIHVPFWGEMLPPQNLAIFRFVGIFWGKCPLPLPLQNTPAAKLIQLVQIFNLILF
jgi:hypothetical protein